MKRLMALGLAICMGAAAVTGCTNASSGTTTAAQAEEQNSAGGSTGTGNQGAGGTGTAESTGAGDQSGAGSTGAGDQTGAADTAAGSQAMGQKAASGLDKLVVTYVESPLNVPSIIEKNQGIFTKNFQDMGIKVKYAEITSGADQTQALASGDVQILYGVGATSVILSAANGADIKVLNMYSRSPKSFCMYSKDKSLTTPESLKGKTIAGPAGTNLHELLAAYLAKGGMTIDDVNFVNMAIPDAKAGLDGGSVDVALIAGPAAYQAKEQGYHMVADGQGLIKAIIAVAVRQDFYDANQDVIKRFIQAQDEIAGFMKDHQDEALKIVAKEMDLDETAVKEMYGYYDFSTAISKDDIEGFQKTADFMAESHMIDQPLDVNTLFFK